MGIIKDNKYIGSNGQPIALEDMTWLHLENAIKKAEREGDVDTAEALQKELDSRPKIDRE